MHTLRCTASVLMKNGKSTASQTYLFVHTLREQRHSTRQANCESSHCKKRTLSGLNIPKTTNIPKNIDASINTALPPISPSFWCICAMVEHYMQLVAHPQRLCAAALPPKFDGFNSEIILMCSFYSLCATLLHISLWLCNQEAHYVFI